MVNLLAITIPATVYIAVDCCKGRGHYIRITLLQAQETYVPPELPRSGDPYQPGPSDNFGKGRCNIRRSRSQLLQRKSPGR